MVIVNVSLVTKILMMMVTVRKVGKLQILKKIALHHLQLLLLLACTACTGANRKCKDGDCVCEIGYQAIEDDGDCEEGTKNYR